MEILAALIFLAAAACLFVILYRRKKRGEARTEKFFAANRIERADYYQAELPPTGGQDFICRKMSVPAKDGRDADVHWCEYRAFTHEYTTPSAKIFINYSIISFPRTIVDAELTEKISAQIDRSGTRLGMSLRQRIKYDSERPTGIKKLENGDLATFWTSRNNTEDAQYKIKWIKETLG